MDLNAECAFLLLPSEIRNEIYRLALTHTSPLIFRQQRIEKFWKPTLLIREPDAEMIFRSRPDDARTSRPESSPMPVNELNQLKYTCRQLYKETAGLELRFNTVSFSLFHDVDMDPAERLVAFWKTLSPTRNLWLRTIVITPLTKHEQRLIFVKDSLPPAAVVAELAVLCKQQPRVKYSISQDTFVADDRESPYDRLTEPEVQIWSSSQTVKQREEQLDHDSSRREERSLQDSDSSYLGFLGETLQLEIQTREDKSEINNVKYCCKKLCAKNAELEMDVNSRGSGAHWIPMRTSPLDFSLDQIIGIAGPESKTWMRPN
ncbi:hypothetical protein BDV96DRAFT_595417 [Lophiotrema nucula]|uniref:Uncharacterized protein n=1 Tax=Lophiotrema nucula TaxID=690887 RepID=A0A6A5ZPE5_9PLEO|nr:hypothetical protein BDV96DRAFT_595417 [Lophiotrema nucula]